MRNQKLRLFLIILFTSLAVAACTLKSKTTSLPQDEPPGLPIATNPPPEIVVQTEVPPAQPLSTSTTQATLDISPGPAQIPPSELPISSCDRITIEADTSIPDGTLLLPGQVFIKAWRVRNSGDCVWTPGYQVALFQGDPLGASDYARTVFVPPDSNLDLLAASWQPQRFNIQPGETVDLAMLFQAPPKPGSYTGTWSLVNESNERIDPLFWVSITVSEEFNAEGNPWAGAWNLQDPYTGRSAGQPFFLYVKNEAFYGVFYDSQGEMNLITGWMGKDPQVVKGEFGPPGQVTGRTFIWSLLEKEDQFQGAANLNKFTVNPWCGSRPGIPLPQPCLLETE